MPELDPGHDRVPCARWEGSLIGCPPHKRSDTIEIVDGAGPLELATRTPAVNASRLDGVKTSARLVASWSRGHRPCPQSRNATSTRSLDAVLLVLNLYTSMNLTSVESCCRSGDGVRAIIPGPTGGRRDGGHRGLGQDPVRVSGHRGTGPAHLCSAAPGTAASPAKGPSPAGITRTPSVVSSSRTDTRPTSRRADSLRSTTSLPTDIAIISTTPTTSPAQQPAWTRVHHTRRVHPRLIVNGTRRA